MAITEGKSVRTEDQIPHRNFSPIRALNFFPSGADAPRPLRLAGASPPPWEPGGRAGLTPHFAPACSCGLAGLEEGDPVSVLRGLPREPPLPPQGTSGGFYLFMF